MQAEHPSKKRRDLSLPVLGLAIAASAAVMTAVAVDPAQRPVLFVMVGIGALINGYYLLKKLIASRRGDS